ncbi:esterase of the alpha-beta hydrolase superfamily protein [Legionella birminghamensis]|uniref:Esterase of the alpha-beta hydrolase superfamily n=1 Tax=Legionella birminghamensis TaxID=28083 RepID=A0A378I9U3_9GAMM|nr:Dot/Icm T4SS effector VpdC [Legionella birminghamensis]KTC69283.1 esterase of the alpha-beta hydrolase superfamily protein [Legionella birminghamensis]STX31545.1 esterase of the alpha-beta hydrolase superfamily [Legionella birminghamensis]
MPKEQVLKELISQNSVFHPNSQLLRKLVLTVYYGWLRINGQPPDKQFSLADYVFDEEKFVIDFNGLTETARKKFNHWLWKSQANNAHRAFLSSSATTDYRGYTAEVGLSWWGRIVNWVFYRKKSYQWPLAPVELTFDYQLNGIEICKGKHGLLVGLNQFCIETQANKYHQAGDAQEEPLLNTKRVQLTDEMVGSLLELDIENQDYDSILNQPHPFSIEVKQPKKRMKAMYEHRKVERFITPPAWYQRVWEWTNSFFKKKKEWKSKAQNNFHSILKKENAEVLQQAHTGEILIMEKRPEIDTMVFCGGGAKIFAHVGAYKAFQESGIQPSKFAGSSAGAIMAILCYLGYSWVEIFGFFKSFKEENIVHYNIDSSGISDTDALKAALDFMIIKKVNQILSEYETIAGKEAAKELRSLVYEPGVITFESLKRLKQAYPKCCLGDELIVTATNKEKRKTVYFSYGHSPQKEVSKAGAMSSSFPIVFKPTLLPDGNTYNDGGILSNLPTEAFSDDKSTFLKSDYDNCLKLVAFQFDNGPERSILNKLVHRVYRENFLWNWIYGLLTGVRDPVSGWERDRLKLLHYSGQTVLIPIGNVSATQFDICAEDQEKLLEKGYKAAKRYIDSHYQISEKGARNAEYLHVKFSGIDEAIYYSCYRGHRDWFEALAKLGLSRGISEEKIEQLRRMYFNSSENKKEESSRSDKNKGGLFDNQLPKVIEKKAVKTNMRIFQAIYPIFLEIPYEWINKSSDLKLYKDGRHANTIHSPLRCLQSLSQIKGKTHILFHIFVELLKNQTQKNIEELCRQFKILEKVLSYKKELNHHALFDCWNLLPHQVNRILKICEQKAWDALAALCESLKIGEEPLQDIVYDEPKEKDACMDKWYLHSVRKDIPVDSWYEQGCGYTMSA